MADFEIEEPKFDLSKYTKAEDYFAAYERFLDAQREWWNAQRMKQVLCKNKTAFGSQNHAATNTDAVIHDKHRNLFGALKDERFGDNDNSQTVLELEEEVLEKDIIGSNDERVQELIVFEQEQNRLKREEALQASLVKEEETKASCGPDDNSSEPMITDSKTTHDDVADWDKYGEVINPDDQG